ncbi:MAG: CoA pyrophosphatase [Hahellaceae bacterium]|nr:CoA pyrophosphatase [Hahellaceae bacterium]MCP5168907.1 CoA pyrophosphatase [Hahellaceae bacterium]
MISLEQIQHKLHYRRAKTQLLRRFMIRSSVAAMIRENHGQLEVLLIKRAERKGDRWSGHMAFPGGRVQVEDMNTRATAIRETEEEIGYTLPLENYLGRLSDVMTLAHGTKKPMVVSPYIFSVEGEPEFSLNHEVDRVVWLPLSFLANRDNRESMRWERKGVGMTLPCYFYEGHRIWGLTLKMLDELVFDIIRES